MKIVIRLYEERIIMSEEAEQIITEKQSEVVAQFYGSIDKIDNGVVSGWAANMVNASALNIQVICNGEVVGSGDADKYRKDLEDANIHEGNHAFSINIDDNCLVESKGLHFSLIDSLTSNPINDAELTITVESKQIFVDILKEENGYIVSKVTSEFPLGNKTIELFSGSKLIHQLELNTDSTEIEIKQPIPDYLKNGNSNEFKIRILGGLEFIAESSVITTRVNTKLFFYPDYTVTNPYQTLLYSNLSGCDAEPLTIDLAIQFLIENKPSSCIFHIHWQNIITGPAKTAYEHRKLAKEFIAKLNYFKKLGGTLIWTIHNKLPHDIKFKNAEIEFHESMSSVVDMILLHDINSIDIIKKEYNIDKKKVQIIEHGNYIGSYPNLIDAKDSRELLELEENNIVFGFVGQLRPYKGLNEFIEASVKLVKAKNVNALIAGKPVWPITSGKVDRRCQLYPGIKVFEGFVPDEELQIYLNSSDFIVLPYKDILTSGSVLLAVSFGKPVIIPDIPAFSSIKDEDFVFTYDPTDNDSLLNLLQDLSVYNKKEILRVGECALKYASNLCWTRISNELSNTINALTTKNSSLYSANYENRNHDVEVFGDNFHKGMAICVVNYFSFDLVEKLISTLNEYSTTAWTLYLLDNSESDSEFSQLQRTFDKSILIKPEANLGYAAGNNILINYAKSLGASEFAILNPDMLLCEDVIQYMTEVVRESNGIHSPVILRENELVSFYSTNIDSTSSTLKVDHHYAGSKCDFLPKGVQESDSLNGCALFFSKQTVDEFGYIPEEYFLYFEETDWTWSAKKSGAKLQVHGDINIIHSKDSQKGGLPTLAYTYYLLRGALLFAAKHGFDVLSTRKKFEDTFVKPWLVKIKERKSELENIFSTISLAAFEDGVNGVTGKVDLFETLEKYSCSEINSVGFIDYCDGQFVKGWAVTNDIDHKMNTKVLIYVAGTYKGLIEPNIFRKDIEELGYSAKAGFSSKLEVDDFSKIELIDSITLKRLKKTSVQEAFVINHQAKLPTYKAPNFKCNIDGIKNGHLSGWAIDLKNQNIPLDLELYINDILITSTVANTYRADLEKAKLNNGCCAFSIIIPPSFVTYGQVNVGLRLIGEKNHLITKQVHIENVINGYDTQCNLNAFLNWSYINVITPFGMYEKSAKLQRELSFVKNNLVSHAQSVTDERFITVIMPAYNRSSLIKDSINSVLEQTYTNYELIVIDDGSNDDTCAVVNEIIQKNTGANIKLIELEKNSGVSFARNRGLDNAIGEIITYLDSDNVWDEEYLNIVNSTYVTHENSDSAYAGQEIYYFDREINCSYKTAIRLLPFNRSKMENENFIDLNVFSHRKTLFDTLGGFKEELRRLVDWDLILKYTDEKPPVLIPALLNKYYFGLADNQITSVENFEKNIKKLLEGL
jgi:GT2 family glycosyltransferase/glycosyltransferase involved in cell wall biosynthesis